MIITMKRKWGYRRPFASVIKRSGLDFHLPCKIVTVKRNLGMCAHFLVLWVFYLVKNVYSIILSVDSNLNEQIY